MAYVLPVPEKIGSRVKFQGADPALRAFFEARGYVVEYVTSTGHYIMRRDYREAAPDAVPGAKPPPRLSFEVC